jgi:chromosomal replication initiation ATPase DnaA
MMHVKPQTGSYEAQLRAEHLARRQRLMGAPQPKALPKPAPKMPLVKKAFCYREKPMWKQVTITFSDHVYRWQFYQASQSGAPVRDFIETWCRRQLINVTDVLGESRAKPITAFRHRLMWEVRNAFPALSLPAIARIFGRDHTTVLSAIRKVGAERKSQ